MKSKYIFALLLFLSFVFSTYYISRVKIANPVIVKEVFSSNNLNSTYNILKIEEDKENYKVKIFYPKTNYQKLNEEINKKIKELYNDFKDEISEDIPSVQGKRSIEANFDIYEYKSYISYVFQIFADIGGAHPNTYIYTISYDIKNNQIININELIKKDPNILITFSEISRKELSKNCKIKEYGNKEMLSNGTEKLPENFTDFAFDSKGIILFFEKYAVAPYVAGEFLVCIPYDKIKI